MSSIIDNRYIQSTITKGLIQIHTIRFQSFSKRQKLSYHLIRDADSCGDFYDRRPLRFFGESHIEVLYVWHSPYTGYSCAALIQSDLVPAGTKVGGYRWFHLLWLRLFSKVTELSADRLQVNLTICIIDSGSRAIKIYGHVG